MVSLNDVEDESMLRTIDCMRLWCSCYDDCDGAAGFLGSETLLFIEVTCHGVADAQGTLNRRLRPEGSCLPHIEAWSSSFRPDPLAGRSPSAVVKHPLIPGHPLLAHHLAPFSAYYISPFRPRRG